MKYLLAMAAASLAGCATQMHSGTGPASATPHPRSMVVAPDPGTTLRIGVEYLPPELDHEPPEVRPIHRPVPEKAPEPHTTLAERTRVPEARHTWALSTEDLGDLADPIERTALLFVSDLLREDERRSKREVCLPFFDWQPTDEDLGQRLWSEEDLADGQAEWLAENGASLLAKPAKRILKRLPITTELEVSLDEFRSSCLPLTEPYGKRHARERELGHLSLRVQSGDPSNPVEVTYVRSGLRVGTGQETGKLSVDLELSDRLSLILRTRRNWHSGDHVSRVDLAYRMSSRTSLRVAAGDDMEFLSTSSAYSMFEDPMDGAPGLVLYAVHVF